MEQTGTSPEAERAARTENTAQSLKTTLEALSGKDPEMVDLANRAISNMIVALANAKPGPQTEELKGELLGTAMVFNHGDEISPNVMETPVQGKPADAVRVGQFVNRVRNRVGTINEKGEAVVKVALGPGARTTTAALPK